MTADVWALKYPDVNIVQLFVRDFYTCLLITEPMFDT